MKRIVCFGDSNTWGYNPSTSMRHAFDRQWTTLMEQTLGSAYQVIPEGLNGRTTVWPDPIEEYKCGKDHIVPCVKSHQPFDLLIIMLGTNDLKKRFSVTAFDIAEGARTLVRLARSTSDVYVGVSPPEILLVAPPPLGPLTRFASMFEDGGEKSKSFGTEYARVAEEESCHFLDAGAHVRSSAVDGVHFDESELPGLASALAEKVRSILQVSGAASSVTRSE